MWVNSGIWNNRHVYNWVYHVPEAPLGCLISIPHGKCWDEADWKDGLLSVKIGYQWWFLSDWLCVTLYFEDDGNWFSLALADHNDGRPHFVKEVLQEYPHYFAFRSVDMIQTALWEGYHQTSPIFRLAVVTVVTVLDVTWSQVFILRIREYVVGGFNSSIFHFNHRNSMTFHDWTFHI